MRTSLSALSVVIAISCSSLWAEENAKSTPPVATAPSAGSDTPMPITCSMYDPSLHLFVDDHHIRNIFAMKRVFGKPQKMDAPILEDIPGRMVNWACVMREPNGLFRAWYLSGAAVDLLELWKAGVWGKEGNEFGYFPERHPDAIPETQLSVISYAQSKDGLNWVKPELGLIEWRGNKANNIVLDGANASKQYDRAVNNMDAPSVIRDDADPDPAKRYKMINHWETFHIYDEYLAKIKRPEEVLKKLKEGRQKYLTTSPDGIHWDAPLVRIKNCSGGGDYCGVTRDERNGVYWFNDRGRRGVNDVSFRSAGLVTSKDLYTWPDTVEQVLVLGEYEDYGRRWEHHGMVPFNYGDQDLGFVELCLSTKLDWTSVLVSHRDGQRWQFPNDRQPFLSLGPKGSFDDSIVLITRNTPVRVGDTLYIYYNGRHYVKRVRP